jgi:hypothetical protein
MEMARLRGVGIVAVVGLAVGLSGCTATPASSAQVAEVHGQAQEALARWDAAVAADAGGSGFILVGDSTLMVGDDWGPKIDGGNAKMAWYAGLFVPANPLPSEAPPDGSIQWQDGTTHAVPVISAEQALSDMKATGGQPCPDCIPLQITGATLTTATFQTSRGPAQAPAWKFSLKDTDVKLDQVAVGGRITPPPVADQASQTSVGPAVQSATVDASGMTLTVSVVGAQYGADKPCGADYTAEAVESDTALVVIVYEHRNTAPAVCSLVGYSRTAQVTLAKPLAGRTLIDMQAQPISVTADH